MDLPSLKAHGLELYNDQKFQEAADCLHAVLKANGEQKDPPDQEALEALTDCWRSLSQIAVTEEGEEGYLKQAKTLLLYGIQNTNEPPPVWFFELAQLREDETSIECYEEGCNRIVKELQKSGGDEEVKQELKRDFCGACCNAVETLMSIEGRDKAEEKLKGWLEKCYNMDQDFLDQYRWRASLYIDANKMEAAKVEASKAFEILQNIREDPSSPEVALQECIELAKVMLELTMLDEADLPLSMMREMDNEDEYVWYLVGVRYELGENWRNAVRSYRKSQQFCGEHDTVIVPPEGELEERFERVKQILGANGVQEVMADDELSGSDDEEGIAKGAKLGDEVGDSEDEDMEEVIEVPDTSMVD